MAHKASTITYIDMVSNRVGFIPFGGNRERNTLFDYLPKVDRVQVLKAMGVTFTGSPMHRKDDELNRAYYEQKEVLATLKGINRLDLNSPKEEEKMPTPTPAPQPSPKVTQPTPEGGLDAILRRIVEDVIGDYVPEIPAGDIINKVNESMKPYLSAFDNVIDQVTSLQDVIATMQPKITEVKLPLGEVRKLEGVQHYEFPKVLENLHNRISTYLVGPAGTGKSTIAENASKALGLDFYSKSCSSQSTESSLLGYMSATGEYVGTAFRKAYEFGGVYLLDEVDNGNANILTVLNSALSNGFMAFPDGMVSRHSDFVLVTTANTFGHGATAQYVGRNPLDEAFLDRFAQLPIDYDKDIEEAMLNAVGLNPTDSAKWLNVVRMARQNAENYGLRVIISPRATVHGAKMLTGTAYTLREVVEATILKGAKPDIAEKILAGVAL